MLSSSILWTEMEAKLALYFLLQSVFALSTTASYISIGLSHLYGFIYSVLTTFILIVVLHIVKELLRLHGKPILVACSAALLTEAAVARTFVAVDHMTWYFWILGAEASVLLWAGMITMGAAKLHGYRRTLYWLGLYWIVEAGYDFAFCLRFPDFLQYNTWIPQMTGLLVFFIILFRWKRDSEDQRTEQLTLAREFVNSRLVPRFERHRD